MPGGDGSPEGFTRFGGSAAQTYDMARLPTYSIQHADRLIGEIIG